MGRFIEQKMYDSNKESVFIKMEIWTICKYIINISNFHFCFKKVKLKKENSPNFVYTSNDGTSFSGVD